MQHSIDPKITGMKDASGQARIVRTKFSNPQHYDEYITYLVSLVKDNFLSLGKPLNFSPQLEYMELYPQAKLTDFVDFNDSLSTGRYLVSPTAQRVLSQFDLPTYAFYPVNLYQNNKLIEGYQLLYYTFAFEFEQVVDISKSKFYLQRTFRGTKVPIEIKNYFDYISKLKQNPLHINSENIFFNNQFKFLDFFSIQYLSIDIYVSQRLKEAIEAAGLTGLEFKEAVNPSFEFE